MKPELEHFLIKRYPDFFEHTHIEDNGSLYWGIECDDGWFQILFDFLSLTNIHIESLKRMNEQNKKTKKQIEAGISVGEYLEEQYKKGKLIEYDIPEFKLDQIKEKFGTLRIYSHNSDEYIESITQYAQYASNSTCEKCGNKGKIRNSGWLKVLCDKHAIELNYPIQQNNNIGDIIQALSENNLDSYKIISINENIYTLTLAVPTSDANNKEQIFQAKLISTDVFSYFEII